MSKADARERITGSNLTNLAKETRAKISENIATQADAAWTLFWHLPPNGADACKEGFYTYGICGNVFGKDVGSLEEIPQSCQTATDRFEVFYRDRYQAMIQASLRVLLFLNRT